MKTVILAAGEGKRLRPLTETIPKPLIEIHGKPIISHLIDSLIKCGLNDFIVVTHYKESLIKEYLLSSYSNSNFDFVHQNRLLGTANAFLLTKNYIQDDFFLGLNGDCLYSFSLIQRFVDSVKRKQVTLGGKLVTDTEKYGIIKTDNQEIPTTIIEKPPKGDILEGFANIGLYGLHKNIMNYLASLEEKKMLSSRGEYELPDAINNLLEERFPCKLIKLQDDEYWFDIGRPWAILEANSCLMQNIPPFNEGIIEEGVHTTGKIIIQKDARVRSGTYIEGPVFIGEGADIGPNCYIRKNTYLGKNTRVGNACEIKNSVLYDDTHVAHLSYVGDSVIGPRVNFGAGTITANLRLDKKTIPFNIKGIRTDSQRRKLGAIIGEGVQTGIGALLMPGTKIGSFAWVGSGTIVDEDIKSNTIMYTTQKKTVVKHKNAN